MQLLAGVRQVNRGSANPHHCRRSPPGEHQHPHSRQSGTDTRWMTSAVNTTSTCTSTTSHRHTLNDFNCQCNTHQLQVDTVILYSVSPTVPHQLQVNTVILYSVSPTVQHQLEVNTVILYSVSPTIPHQLQVDTVILYSVSFTVPHHLQVLTAHTDLPPS